VGTDLHFTILHKEKNGKIEGDGAVLLPPRFYPFAKSLLQDVAIILTYDKDENKISVVQGADISASFNCVPPSEYPPIPAFNNEGYRLPAKDLKRALNLVTFSASEQAQHRTLTGVLMNVAGDKLELAAADGFRLSVASLTLPDYSELQDGFSAIIPAASLAELSRVIEDNHDVLMRIDGKEAILRTDNTLLKCSVIDGEFPDYKRIIPSDSPQTTITVDRKRLIDALDRARIFARDILGIVNLEKAGTMLTTGADSYSTKNGKGNTTLVINTTGPDIKISFNVNYLLDVLSVLHGDDVTIEFNTANHPCTIREDGYVHVLMPMSQT
jgi:DNA polymerase-3 subunit beta